MDKKCSLLIWGGSCISLTKKLTKNTSKSDFFDEIFQFYFLKLVTFFRNVENNFFSLETYFSIWAFMEKNEENVPFWEGKEGPAYR